MCNRWHFLIGAGTLLSVQEGELKDVDETLILNSIKRLEATVNALATARGPSTLQSYPFKHSTSNFPRLGPMSVLKKTLTSFGYKQFKTLEQLYASQIVLGGVDSVHVSLPTGSGKTLVYLLAIKIEKALGKFSIVLVPYNALLNQLELLMNEHGITTTRYTETLGTLITTDALLVQAEYLSHDAFWQLVYSLHQTGRLARVILEEAHLFIIQEAFRDAFYHLSRLQVFPGQIVLVSATTPLQISEELGLKVKKRFITVGISQVATTLRFEVVMLPDDNDSGFLCQVVKYVTRGIESMEQGQRIIIFCMSIDNVKTVAATLSNFSCFSYFGPMTAKEKMESISGWTKANKGIMIATSAFGTGVDYPNVKQVIHLCGSYSLLEFIQETGRCGRVTAGCSTLLTCSWGLDESKMDIAMVNYAKNKTLCRRTMLNSHLGGPDTSCDSLQELEPCDVCQPIPTHSPSFICPPRAIAEPFLQSTSEVALLHFPPSGTVVPNQDDSLDNVLDSMAVDDLCYEHGISFLLISSEFEPW